MKKTLAIALVAAAVTGCASNGTREHTWAGQQPRVMSADYVCNYPFQAPQDCATADQQLRELEWNLKEANPLRAALSATALVSRIAEPFGGDGYEARQATAITSRQYKSCVWLAINRIQYSCPEVTYQVR